MPSSSSRATRLTAAIIPAFSAALGFMGGLVLYGARVAVLEAQQSSFTTELREVKAELISIHSDIQTLTLQVKSASYSGDSTALRAESFGLVSRLPHGSNEHRQPRPAVSYCSESLWCDTRGRGRERHVKRSDKRRKVKRAA